MNDKYLIEVYDQEGKLFRKIDRPYKPLPVTNKDAQRYLEGFSDVSLSDLALIEKNVRMPSVKTITERMIVDDGGNLWVETNEEKETDGRIFMVCDIFNKDGFYAFPTTV